MMNESLKQSANSIKVKENLIFGKDYIVVPPRVWIAFTGWYGKTFVVRRKIIEYSEQLRHLRTSVRNPDEFQDKQGAMKEKVKKSEDMLIRARMDEQGQKLVVELETDEVLLKYGRIQDDAKQPPVLYEIYVSRKITIYSLLKILAARLCTKPHDHFAECSINNTRLWDSVDSTLGEECHAQTLETTGLKVGTKILVEFKLESGEWPVGKEKITKTRSEASRSKGCTNVGNTCYMNASIACIANTPFVREFFTGTTF